MRVLALTALVGCGFEHGRVGTGIDAPLGDAVDAPPDMMPCTSAWGTPKPLTELNTTGIDNAPWLSDDELTIYFTSDRFGSATTDWDIFVATRGSITEPFNAPAIMGAISTNAMERNLSLTPDGLTMFFASDRGGGLGSLDLWMVTRNSTNDDFTNGDAVPLTAINSAVQDYFPTISRDGLTLYFSSIRTGGAGNYDIYKATRSSLTGELGLPTNLGPPISTAAGEAALAFSHDELTLYLQSTRGSGTNWDQWRAERASSSGAFSTPTKISELSTANTEYIRWVSADGQRAYFASTPPTSTIWDLYVVERTCM